MREPVDVESWVRDQLSELADEMVKNRSDLSNPSPRVPYLPPDGDRRLPPRRLGVVAAAIAVVVTLSMLVVNHRAKSESALLSSSQTGTTFRESAPLPMSDLQLLDANRCKDEEFVSAAIDIFDATPDPGGTEAVAKSSISSAVEVDGWSLAGESDLVRWWVAVRDERPVAMFEAVRGPNGWMPEGVRFCP